MRWVIFVFPCECGLKKVSYFVNVRNDHKYRINDCEGDDYFLIIPVSVNAMQNQKTDKKECSVDCGKLMEGSREITF